MGERRGLRKGRGGDEGEKRKGGMRERRRREGMRERGGEG